MGKRRKRLLSMALVVGLLVSNLSSYSTVLAAGTSGMVPENKGVGYLNEDPNQSLPSDTAAVIAETEALLNGSTGDTEEDQITNVPNEVQEVSDEVQEVSDAPDHQGDTEAVSETTKEAATEETQTTQQMETANTDDKNLKAVSSTPINGLFAEYFTTKGDGRNVTIDQMKTKSVDYSINFGNMDPKLMMTTGMENKAGVRWTGRIQAPESGNYTLYALVDNGIRLWIDGKQVMNYWDAGSWDVLQRAEVTFEKDRFYDIKAEYFEYDGGSHATLSWSNNKSITEKKVIPSSAYFMPANYDGIYIGGLDTSQANLKEGETFDGNITVKGQNLDRVTSFEVVRSSGESLNPPAIAEITSQASGESKIVIPSISSGTYKMKIKTDDAMVLSKGLLVVKPDAEEKAYRTENPRADWERDSYVNLNGQWQFDFDPEEEGRDAEWFSPDKEFEQSINVPFCWEAPLSGISNEDYMGQAWYKRTVQVDQSWAGKKIFLKFGAVDWKCKLWVNGKEVGDHVGGYSAFEMDVTEFMNVGEENVVTLWVEDKGSYGDDSYPALIGKQGRNAPCGYAHTSGIWQTVGMEARSATYLDNAKAASDIDNATVNYTLDVTSDKDQKLTIEYDFESTLYDVDTDQDIKTGSKVKGKQEIAVVKGANSIELAPIVIQNQKLWNYNEANLYQGTLIVKDAGNNVLDELSTYFGQRKVETKYYNEDLGVKYIYVNDAPVYMSGLLDQGFWEEGIYTAPSEEALKYDILAMKEAGFNMIRKHLKVEDPLQYYWCDKLGMMVWQDMPHATAMVPSQPGGEALGRKYFEECLDSMMNMNYNHPSIVAVMLFNETWGLYGAYNDNGANRHVKASDGMDTAQWVESLYNKTKELNPNILVEDMSPCNEDHVQPTELNTYHMYPNSYLGTLSAVERYVNNAYVGSTNNFKFGEKQDGDPLLNSEYGGVAAYAGDFDVSYCFKFMTDVQRRYEKQSGFVYTEPYDVEYERNGILTYDRKLKEFGYDEIAYGGDMQINDLVQDTYIGIVDSPIKNVKPGQRMKINVMAMSWTNDTPENTVVKWRFDGTDIYGNSISTNSSGTLGMELKPYEKATASLSFRAPTQACVGTLTIWIEAQDGTKIAKNFSNIVVADPTSENKALTLENEDGSVTMKAKVEDGKMVTTKGAGSQNYTYTLPENFDLNDLSGLKVLAEASSFKGKMGTDKNKPSYISEYSQTAEGRELASDLTVLVNGVEIDTVYLPDNPRDMRGTLTLNAPYNGATSAGDFGYLVNLNVTNEKLAAIKSAVGDDKTITVTYQVKEDAENMNGLRIYNSIYGRYAVNPTIILNPADINRTASVTTKKTIDTKSNNYSVEGVLNASASFLMRTAGQGGYKVILEDGGSTIALLNNKTNSKIGEVRDLAPGAHHVKVTLFDEQIRVYADKNAEPVMNVYDKSGFTGGVTVNADTKSPVTDLVVSPESYKVKEAEIDDTVKDVDISDDFSNPNYTERYEVMGNAWTGNVVDGALNITASDQGDKMIMKNGSMSDGIYEMDITVTNSNAEHGNAGFIFRSSNYNMGPDGADGYYAGIGDGYVQLGRMNQGWLELAKASVPELRVNTTHTLRVAVFGSRIQIYVDDAAKPCIDVTDNSYLEGGIAVRGYRVAATLDNIRVRSIPKYFTGFDKGSTEWEASGIWKVEKGAYTSASSNSYSLIDSNKIKDQFYSAELKFNEEDSSAAMLIRTTADSDGLNGYQLVADAKNDKIRLVKSENGKLTVLSEAGWRLDKGKTYPLTVEIKGSTIKAYTGNNKEALVIAEDTTFDAGQVGIMNVTGSVALDNVVINDSFIDGNQMKPADRAAFDKAYEAAKKVEETKYTAESYAKVKEALALAAGTNPFDQKELDAAEKALTAAVAQLKIKPVDLTALNNKIAEAKRLDASKYTPDSYARVRDALAKAETVNKNDQAAVDTVLKNLTDAIAQLKVKPVDVTALNAKIAEAKKLVPGKYTPDSYAKVKTALAKAEAVNRNDQAAVNAAVKELTDAIGQLKLKPAVPKKNAQMKSGNFYYKVTKSAEKNGTVMVVKPVKKTYTSVSIPKTVKLNGYTFKVTEIYKNAFKNNKNLKTVKISDNVTTIGASAFEGCKKLKTVTIGKGLTTIGSKTFYGNKVLKTVVINSTKVKKVGSKSFSGIDKKAYLNVPNSKAKSYKKVFKNSGMPKTIKMK